MLVNQIRLKWALCLLIYLGLSVTVNAQEDTVRERYFISAPNHHHPDGFVGQVSLHGAFQYASVSRSEGTSGVDWQTLDLGLNVVAAPRVTLMSRFLTTAEDSTRYEFNGGLRFYVLSPDDSGRVKNPDGCLWGPVITLLGGLRGENFSGGETKSVADLQVSLPVASKLSIGAGYRFFEDIGEADVEQAYGSVSYYSSRYYVDSAYVNPDGPVGSLTARLIGGGSSKGSFGDIALLFPVSKGTTLWFNIRGERATFPYKRSAAGGVGFSFYPPR